MLGIPPLRRNCLWWCPWSAAARRGSAELAEVRFASPALVYGGTTRLDDSAELAEIGARGSPLCFSKEEGSRKWGRKNAKRTLDFGELSRVASSVEPRRAAALHVVNT
jgi:hypothetical protein